MKKKDTQEILEAISRVEYRLGQRIDDVDQKLSAKIEGVERSLSQRIDGVNTKIEGVEGRLSDQIDLLAREVHKTHGRLDDLHEAVDAFASEIDRKLIVIGSKIVTKEYLDRKYSNWRDEIIVHVKERVPGWKEKGIQKTAQ